MRTTSARRAEHAERAGVRGSPEGWAGQAGVMAANDGRGIGNSGLGYGLSVFRGKPPAPAEALLRQPRGGSRLSPGRWPAPERAPRTAGRLASPYPQRAHLHRVRLLRRTRPRPRARPSRRPESLVRQARGSTSSDCPLRLRSGKPCRPARKISGSRAACSTYSTITAGPKPGSSLSACSIMCGRIWPSSVRSSGTFPTAR